MKKIYGVLKNIPLINSVYRNMNRPLNKVYRKQNIAMFHTGRCGSTVLGNMLNQHPMIYWGGEIFERYMENEQKKVPGFIECIDHARNLKVSRIYGFETKYLPQQHLSLPCINMTLEDYVGYLRHLGFTKFIVLHRENYLRRAISAEVGRKTKIMHSNNEVKSATKVIIDITAFQTGVRKESLLELFHCMNENYKKLCDILMPNEAIFLSFEKDILEDPRKAYVKICRFLDIKDTYPKIKNKRTNPFSYEELIENFDDVKAAIQNTQYSWMLDD